MSFRSFCFGGKRPMFSDAWEKRMKCYEFKGFGFKNGLGLDQDDIVPVTATVCVHPDDDFLMEKYDYSEVYKTTISKTQLDNPENWVEASW